MPSSLLLPKKKMPKGRSNNYDAAKRMKKGKIKVDVDLDTCANTTPTKQAPIVSQTEIIIYIDFAQE
jgi:hypothetical protein